MAKKISKNSKVGRGKDNVSSKDFVKVVKSIKDPVSGKYSYKEMMIHKDNVKTFLEAK